MSRFSFFWGIFFLSLKKFFREEKLFKVLIGTIFLIVVFSAIVFYFEVKTNADFKNFKDAVWWGFVTGTTLGYGDLVPKTTGGRVAAVFLMFLGLSFLSVLTAGIASKFIEKTLIQSKGFAKMNFKNHFVICGISFNLEKILKELEKISPFSQVLVVGEISEQKMRELKVEFNSIDLFFIVGDFVKEEVLTRANITKAKSVLILADQQHIEKQEKADEMTIICAYSVRYLSPKVKICVELLNSENKSHLKRINVDDIVISSEYGGFILAQSTQSPGIPQIAEKILSSDDSNAIKRVKIPRVLWGKTFNDALDFFRKEKKSILLGLAKEDKEISVEDIFNDNSAIDNFIKKKFRDVKQKEKVSKKEEKLKVILNPDDNYKISEEDEAIILGKI